MSELVAKAKAAAARILVVGNGNIGSHTAEFAAREPQVGEVTCVDHDSYEKSNLQSQAIMPADVGRPKAVVQAERLLAIRGDGSLKAIAIVAAVEDVPLGQLRADICLSGLDTRSGRLGLQRICWRLGIPWVDAGIQSDGLLARISVHVPGDGDAPCYECGLSERDYEYLEQQYSCTGAPIRAAPTNGPSALGALAAAMQVIEARKLLTNEEGACARHKSIVLDARWHKYYVTVLRRNPNCRFDHQVWQIEPLPRVETLDDVMQFVASAHGGGEAVALSVEGKSWVTELACTRCARRRPALRLQRRFRKHELRCGKCGGEAAPVAFSMLPQLRADAIPPRWRRRTLRSMGLGIGDVLTSHGASGERHWEICD